jgi:signal transduction histidine kinase
VFLPFWFFTLLVRRWGLASLLAVSLLLAPGPGSAQRVTADPLLQGLVLWAAVPDPAGWIWLATDRGAFRYDGHRLVPLAALTAAGPRLPATLLTAALRDSAGTLWLGGPAGLWAFTPATGRLHRVPLPGAAATRAGVTALGQHASRLWVGYGTDPLTVAQLPLRQPAAGPRVVLRFARGAVQDFATDAQGHWRILGRQEYWAADAAGRWQRHAQPKAFHGVFTRATGPGRHLLRGTHLPLAAPGRDWELAYDGLYRRPPDGGPAGRVQTWPLPAATVAPVLQIVELDSTWYWSAGPYLLSLSRRHGAAPHVRVRRTPLAFGRELVLVPLPGRPALLGFRRDAPGAVCIAPDERVAAALPVAPRQALSTRAFGRLPDGQLFVSTYEGLFTQPAAAPGVPLRRLAPPEQAGVWLATLPLPGRRLLVANELRFFSVWERGGLHQFSWVGPHPALSEINALCLRRDHAGRYWGGTVAGLFALDPARGQARRYREADPTFPLHFCRIEAVAEGPAGVLWLATNQGLYHLVVATGGLTRYGPGEPAPRTLPTADVRDLLLTDPDSLWLGTFDQGLLLLDPRRGLRRQVGPAQGLPSVSVASLARLPNDPGALWLGTYQGLVRYEPATGRLRTLDLADGLAALECNRHSLWPEAASGRLYVGGVGGASCLADPHRGRPRVTPLPPVRVVALRRQPNTRRGAVTTYLPTKEPPALTLAPGDAYLDIDLALPDYAAGAPARFAYRLVPAGGVPPRWLELGESATLHLENVAPGTYTVQVRGRTADGVTAAQLLRLPLTVALPWQQRTSTWALTALLLAGLLAAAGYAWQRRQAARRQAEQQLRARLAADLHDEVGNLLTRVTLRAELVRELPEPALLDELLAESRAAAATVRDLIWSVDTTADTAGALADRLLDLLSQSGHAAGRATHFERWPADFPAAARLRPDVRQHVYLVGREALTNALKHAPAGAALHLRLTVTPSTLELAIWQVPAPGSPAGLGAPPARAGQGLRSMAARAAMLGGMLESCGPTPDGGWRVGLRVPRPLAGARE